MMVPTLLLLLVASTFAFVPLPLQNSERASSSLHDIAEWRDLVFNFPGTGDDRRLGMEEGAPPKEICILPFPFPEVLLQGETKQLRLYEERCVVAIMVLLWFVFIACSSTLTLPLPHHSYHAVSLTCLKIACPTIVV